MDSSQLKNLVLQKSSIDFETLYFAVPDLHGRVDIARAVVDLLEGIGAQRVTFLGDYIDKGYDSYGVVNVIRQAKARNPDWVFLLGNHEDLYIQRHVDGIGPFEMNNLYKGRTLKEQLELIQFFKTLPIYFKTEYLLFIHGGIDESFDKPIEEIHKAEILWTYDVNPRYAGAKIVHGHDIVPFPVEAANHISCESAGWLGQNSFCISLIANDARKDKLHGVLLFEGFKSNQVKLIVNNSIIE